MIPPKIIINDQIYLSPLQLDDAEKIVACLSDILVTQWLEEVPYPYSLEDAHKCLGKFVDPENKSFMAWSIRDDQDELLGAVKLKNIVANNEARIEYWLANPYWGRGIMSQVVNKICDFSIKELSLNKVYAHVFGDNVAGERVIQKCGFIYEGNLKKMTCKYCGTISCKLYVLEANKK